MPRLPRLPKEEARAATVCAIALAIVAAMAYAFSHLGSDGEETGISDAERNQLQALQQQLRDEAAKEGQTAGNALQTASLFPFDPNHDDSATLRKVGFTEWQVENLMKYRRRGGKWRSADDFSRLYGLSEADFRRLRPYIRIAPEDRRPEWLSRSEDYYGTPKGERPQYEKVDKLAEGSTLPLNHADTTALKRIPGIGSYYAGKIVRYRERLGGFVSVSQINEVEGLPPGVSRWFTVEASPEVRRVNLNKASFKELVRHPYLSYEQTKVIVNHVRMYGPLRSWKDLRLYKEFTDDDFSRLAPYFVFR